MRKKLYLLFLCVAMSIPCVATAQPSFYERQKVVVWEIFDNNNDVKVSSGTKAEIKSKMIEAFQGSRHYEAFECNTADVEQYIKAKGWSMSPQNIARAVGAKYGVNYVIFTSIKTMQHSNSYDDYKVQLSSDFYSTETQKRERAASVDMRSDSSLIPGACAKLLSDLLQENPSSSNNSSYSSSNNSSYSSSSGSSSYSSQHSTSTRQSDYVETAYGLNMKMIFVEGGTFTMGATAEQGSEAEDVEYPAHEVELSSYFIAECEVTQAQWQAVMGTSIYQQGDKKDSSYLTPGVGSNYPMYYVSWYEAQEFCQKLSIATGRTYLLPTEAQWEYAARGGNQSKRYKYSGLHQLSAVGWYGDNSGFSAHPVGQLRANELGIKDMSGNVMEWCSDYYSSYSSTKQYDPSCGSGNRAVIRGGSWFTNAPCCRVSNRRSSAPSDRNYIIGFRVVCIP